VEKISELEYSHLFIYDILFINSFLIRLFYCAPRKAKIWGAFLIFLIGVGKIIAKTMKEALVFSKNEVMGYDIDNNLLNCHGWKQVRCLVQKNLMTR
jgi:hypothetical protein